MRVSSISRPKYARIERERRFLLDRFPENVHVVRIRHITDHYLDGTRLRLRQQKDDLGATIFKLTQKIPARRPGAQQGYITTMYLNAEEYYTLTQLPSKQLTKTRYSVPPFGIDVFDGMLNGLILAESEFESALDADDVELPSFLGREVSDDERFTGGRLVRAARQDLQLWLAEYGIQFELDGGDRAKGGGRSVLP